MPGRLSTEELPLKLRATLVLLREARAHGSYVWATESQGSLSRPVPMSRVCDYHRGVRRDNDPPNVTTGQWLAEQHRAGRYMDWCASSQGWAEHKARLAADVDGLALPPWRSGALELWRDGLASKRGRTLRVADVRAGVAFPTPGSIAVLDRGNGRGHVERVIHAGDNTYLSVGGNEGGRPGRFGIEYRDYSDGDLVGFIECDPLTTEQLVEFGWQLNELDPPHGELSGIDMSHLNAARVDWQQISKDHDFAIFRSSYSDQEDGRIRQFVAGARSVELPMGCYHWFDQTETLQPQIDAFLKALRTVSLPGDIIPWVDVEALPRQTLAVRWWREALPVILSQVEAEFGEAGIYGNSSDLAQLGEGPWSARPLWLAHYTLSPTPRVPPEWPGWVIWQYRADTYPSVPGGRTPGYGEGKIDIDLNRARYLPKTPS